MLSQMIFQMHFNSRRDIISNTTNANDHSFCIVSIMNTSFFFLGWILPKQILVTLKVISSWS